MKTNTGLRTVVPWAGSFIALLLVPNARAEAPTLLARPAYTRPLANEWLTGAVASAVGATSKASAGTRVITLGVGSISVEQDGTSASFDLARYLRERPLRTACGEVTVRLIDYPTEADYSVAGRVTGAIRHAYSSPQSEYAGAGIWGALLTTFGGMAFIAGGAMGYANAYERGRDLPTTGPLIGGALGVVAGLALAILPRALHHAHRYSGELLGQFVIRRRGRKVGTERIPSTVKASARSPLPIGVVALSPIWRGLVEALRKTIDATCAGGAR